MVPEVSAGQGIASGGHDWPDTVSPGTMDENLRTLDRPYPGLVHQPSALVGSPNPRVVSSRRSGAHPCRHGTACRSRTLAPGSRRAGYLVLRLVVAFCHDGRDDAEAFLPDAGPGDRARHHFFLGRAHDHGRARIPGNGAV